MSLSPDALRQGLQYGPTAGMPQLCEWLLDLQEREHGRKRGIDWRVSVTNGSQDAIYKVDPIFYPVTLCSELETEYASVHRSSCEPWGPCTC
jgi:DNA-binding transcriptional MocR family regulator